MVFYCFRNIRNEMEDLANELLSFIFDFIPEDSLELRKVCNDWDFVITKYYNKEPFGKLGTLKEIVEIFYRSKLNVQGIIFLDHIRYIHGFNLCESNIKDVSALGNIHTLDLSATDVENVSGLCNIHTLYLTVTNVKDVSSLSNVHTLDLWGCSNITDFSGLGNVHTLNLNHTNIKDVTYLGNVHTLLLRYTIIKDVSSLGNVRFLYLFGVYVDTSMLKKCH